MRSVKDNTGKILVLGNCQVSNQSIKKVIKSFRMKMSDFEFVSYDEINKFNFKKLLGSNKYSDIFIGPTPHKAKNLNRSTSPHQFLIDNQEELGKIQQLRQKSGRLGISKDNFEEAIHHSNKLYAETCFKQEIFLTN